MSQGIYREVKVRKKLVTCHLSLGITAQPQRNSQIGDLSPGYTDERNLALWASHTPVESRYTHASIKV